MKISSLKGGPTAVSDGNDHVIVFKGEIYILNEAGLARLEDALEPRQSVQPEPARAEQGSTGEVPWIPISAVLKSSELRCSADVDRLFFRVYPDSSIEFDQRPK